MDLDQDGAGLVGSRVGLSQTADEHRGDLGSISILGRLVGSGLPAPDEPIREITAEIRPGWQALVRSGILNYYETLPPEPFRDAGGYDGNNQQPVIAYDGDVAQIASALARLALDAALQREPSHFPCAAYLIGMRKEWIFEQAFDTRPIDITGEGWDLEVGQGGSEADRAEALKALLAMATQAANAEPDPST